MATGGVPWIETDENIKKAIDATNGVVTRACKKLKVCYETLMRRVNESEELMQYLASARLGRSEELLDESEDCLMYSLKNKEADLTNALKTSFYVLNNKGNIRGYSLKNNPTYNDGVSPDELRSFVKELSDNKEVSEFEELSISKMENAESLLDKE